MCKIRDVQVNLLTMKELKLKTQRSGIFDREIELRIKDLFESSGFNGLRI